MRNDLGWVESVTSRLLAATGASRTTLGLRDVWGQAHRVAEACAEGVQSMTAGPPIDTRQAGTIRHLERQQKILVQNDCRTDEPRPPEGLINYHHVYAQMLGPVVVLGSVLGNFSVHQQGKSRQWSQGDMDALAEACSEVGSALNRGDLQLSVPFPMAPPPPAVDEATVRMLVAYAGLPVREEDMPDLYKAVTDYVQKTAPLRAFDLVEPALSLDWNPQW